MLFDDYVTSLINYVIDFYLFLFKLFSRVVDLVANLVLILGDFKSNIGGE